MSKLFALGPDGRFRGAVPPVVGRDPVTIARWSVERWLAEEGIGDVAVDDFGVEVFGHFVSLVVLAAEPRRPLHVVCLSGSAQPEWSLALVVRERNVLILGGYRFGRRVKWRVAVPPCAWLHLLSETDRRRDVAHRVCYDGLGGKRGGEREELVSERVGGPRVG